MRPHLIVVCLLNVFEAAPCSIRAGHWNVYWQALDDADGRQAILSAVDGAAEPFDFFSVVEASGNSEAGRFPTWTEGSSTFGAAGGLSYIAGKSGHETIALFYRSASWRKVYNATGEFESGRPYAIGLFEPSGSCASTSGQAVWVVSAHLPHYPQTQTVPGQVLADALSRHAQASGRPVKGSALLLLGDFNEFGECTLPPEGKCTNDWYAPAKALIEPLWSYLGYSEMADAVDFNTTTCCTKWSDAEKQSQKDKGWQADWRHHFDRLYFTPRFFSASTPTFIDYTYPGVTDCGDACTGNAPSNPTSSQGSWHRGWQLTFTFADEQEVVDKAWEASLRRDLV